MFKFDFSMENLKRGLSNPYQVFDEMILQHAYRLPSVLYNMKFGIGTNIFSREWDVLIILDTCRIDALQSLSDEYDFINEVESHRTVGGATPEWMAKTFTLEYLDEINETAFFGASAQMHSILGKKLPANRSLLQSHITYKLLQYFNTVDIEDLGYVEHLFNYEPKGVSGPFGHIEGFTPPRYVTDRAIAMARDRSFNRMILHYIQPHPPYVVNAIGEDRNLYEYEDRPLRYLRDTGEYDTVWSNYLDELRYVLDDVEIVLANVDAKKVVITADHGEAFGEYGIYGHAIGSLHPNVRNAPWVETSAIDSGSYEPKIPHPNEETDRVNESTEAQLKAMGYRF